MKKVTVIVLILLISILFFGCSKKIENSILNEISNNTIKDEENLHPDEDMSEVPITVFGLDYYNKLITPRFNSAYPDIEVIYDGYGFMAFYEQERNLLQKLVAGVGPDLFILFNSVDIYDFLKQGVFYDLTPYIENEEIFNKEDYVEEVINVGRIDGKQFFIPIEFSISAITTIGKVIEKNDLELDEYLTWDKIKELGEIYNGENESPYLFDSINGSLLIRLCEKPLVEYNLRQSNFSNNDFVNLLKMSMSYFSTPSDRELRELEWSSDGFDKNFCIFSTVLSYKLSIIEKDYLEYGDEYYIYPIQRTSGSRGIKAEVKRIIGINKNADNKDGCFNYMNCLLSDISQLQCCLGLPINKKVYFNNLSYLEKKYQDQDIGNFIKALRNIYENIDDCYILDDYYMRANVLYNSKKDNLSAIELAQRMDASIQKMFELNSEK